MTEVIKVGASWCAPCKAIENALTQLENEHNIIIERIDIEENPDVKELYSIRTIPTIVVKSDRGVFTLSGSKTKTEIEKFLLDNGAI